MEKEKQLLYKTTPRGGRPTRYPGVEVLTELYINQNLTASEIGQRYEVSQNTVRNWLMKARKEVDS
jgi:transposase-like protein